jgi:hypothetical protein
VRLLIRLLLFAVAYVPLLGLLAVRLWSTWWPGAVGFLALGVLLTVVGALLLYLLGRGDQAFVTVESAERLSDTAPNFLLGYVLPFLLLDLADTSVVIAATVFVLFLGFVYARSRMLWANPMLAVAGYHVWRIDGKQTPGNGSQISVVVITRLRDIQQRDVVRTFGDEDGVRLAREN